MSEQFKQLPRFDAQTVNSASALNAISEAVIQLQRVAASLNQQVQELEGSGRKTSTSTRKTAATSK